MRSKSVITLVAPILLLAMLSVSPIAAGGNFQIKRPTPIKPDYRSIPAHNNTNEIIFKLVEGIGQPEFDGTRFLVNSAEFDQLNTDILRHDKSTACVPHFVTEKSALDQMRAEGMRRVGHTLPDLTLYYRLSIADNASADDKLQLVQVLNSLDIVEIAYFAPKPELANIETELALTPIWETAQWYLQPAPTGMNAYYGWSFPGGKGETVKLVDIEGNWVESHEDLHGGTDS